MRQGESVYSNIGKAGYAAHAVEFSANNGRTKTACGRWYWTGDLIHNRGRRQPCARCAEAIERSTDV